MSGNSLLTPTEDDLFEGKVMDLGDEKIRLIRYQPSDEELPYVVYDKERMINWVKRRWLVDVIGFGTTFRTHRKIPVFHSIGVYENDKNDD